MKKYSSHFSSDQHPNLVPGHTGIFIFSFCLESIVDNTYVAQIKIRAKNIKLTERNGEQFTCLIAHFEIRY